MTDPIPTTEALCAYCIEKETGIAHPAHVGRCGMPTGLLGVVSCYCTAKATDQTPRTEAYFEGGEPLEASPQGIHRDTLMRKRMTDPTPTTEALREALSAWDAVEGSDLAAQFRAFLAAGKMADAIRAILTETER